MALVSSFALLATYTVATVNGNTVSPANCSDNGIQLVIGRNPAAVIPGGTITYTVSVSNGVTAGAPAPCDVTNATVTLTLPDPATGQPVGAGATTFTIASSHSFPADGSGDIAPTSKAFIVPANALYASATASASISGSILHDSDVVDDSADITKTSSATVLHPGTTLTTKSVSPATTVEPGTSITVVVTETNSGNTALTGVSVTGGGACAGGFTPAGPISLAIGASADFTCTFTAGGAGSTTSWSADGQGTDSLGNPIPSGANTPEHQAGSVVAIKPATTLTTKSSTPGPNVAAGATVTVVLTETNSGTDPLTAVSVTGGGACAGLFTPASVSLAPGASQDFTCVFTAGAAGTVTSWTADGVGTDSLGHPVPATGEHAEGSVTSIKPATTLTTKSVTPGTTVPAGTSITVTVTETNNGTDPLTGVSVTGGGACAGLFLPAGPLTLAAGASLDFTCTFTAGAAGVTLNWSADGQATDSLGNPVPSGAGTPEHQAGSVTSETPNVTIVKKTNGADANNPNAAGVPNVAPGGAITWTYIVTNTGTTSVPRADVHVTDSTTGVTPTFTSESSGNGDTIFDPGEVWLYSASGTALNLTLPPPAGVTTVADSCTAGGTQPPRTAYTNVGTVTIPGASATDPSSYCNPPPPPPGGIIAPTQTTCSDVLNGTAQTLAAINYPSSGGLIGQGINPGVFFYYAKITTTTVNQVVTVTQTNNSTNNAALFKILNGQAWLWSGDCSSKTTGTLTGGGSGASYTIATPGNYIIGIKYQTKSIAGTPVPVPATITYDFVSSLGASTDAHVLLKPN